MSDTATYGWEAIHAYHGVWLQQLENGWADWKDTECKLEFSQALIWKSVQWGNARSQPSAAPCQLAMKDVGSKPALAKPGTKPFSLFNQENSTTQSEHPADKHIHSYCLTITKRVCSHQEIFCRQKI